MSDANGPQVLYSSEPETVKHDSDYPQLHATAPQQGQGWQERPRTLETSHAATSPPLLPPQHQRHEKRTGRLLLAAACLLLGIIIGGAVVGGALGSVLAGRPPGGAGGTATPAECKTGDPGRVGGTTTSPTPGPSGASSAPRTAATLTNYEAANWRNISTLAFPCPREQGQTVIGVDGTRFRVECGVDSVGLGREAPGSFMEDLQSVIAYSFEDCVQACSSLNREGARVRRGLQNPPVFCRTVVWRSRMDEPSFFDKGGNCFLKNATRAAGETGVACQPCMSGTLL
ncbi:hypothetical protein RB601_008459 [Gaeumannomyces tritici]